MRLLTVLSILFIVGCNETPQQSYQKTTVESTVETDSVRWNIIVKHFVQFHEQLSDSVYMQLDSMRYDMMESNSPLSNGLRLCMRERNVDTTYTIATPAGELKLKLVTLNCPMNGQLTTYIEIWKDSTYSE